MFKTYISCGNIRAFIILNAAMNYKLICDKHLFAFDEKTRVSPLIAYETR